MPSIAIQRRQLRARNAIALFVVALDAFNVGRAWWRERRPQPTTALEQLDSLNTAPERLRR